MTKLQTSFAQRPDLEGGPFRLLWSILCWVTAFAAVLVTTAVLMR
jgi:hypothetical protein